MATGDSANNFAGSLLEVIEAEAILKFSEASVSVPLVKQKSEPKADQITFVAYNAGTNKVTSADVANTAEGTVTPSTALDSEKKTITLDMYSVMLPIYDEAKLSNADDVYASAGALAGNAMASKLDAQIAAKDLDINDLEAIARVVLKGKSNISLMTSSELKRDMIIWAGNNPEEFMDLLNDENLKLRNLAVRAVEMGILHVKSDNRTVVWGDKKSQKVIVVPYGENVYSGLALFFKTDEGLDVLQKITNSL